MKILLLGEYSNVHWTLAEGLRTLGHTVTVVSNGDFWKNYKRDIDLSRTTTKWGVACYIWKLIRLLPRLRGYDVVQLINPMFLELKPFWIKHIYKYLRRHNRKIVMGAFGMDYYWVATCVNDKPLRYSDFNIGDTLRTNNDALREREDWLGTDKELLNRSIAQDCDAIVAGLYEYWVCYSKAFPQKTTFIPYPIKLQTSTITHHPSTPTPVPPYPSTLFIGINKTRSEYKGTDIMLKAAQDIERKYPDRVKLTIAENVPFEKYNTMLREADAILDQLYSYTPAMNALTAMAKGVICIGGGEPENYEILGEEHLRPIINVEPTYESVFEQLEALVTHPERIPQLKAQSREYIERHHNYINVAKRYEKLYFSIIGTNNSNTASYGKRETENSHAEDNRDN